VWTDYIQRVRFETLSMVITSSIGVGGLFRLRWQRRRLARIFEPDHMVPSGLEAWERLRAPCTYICNVDFILAIFVLQLFYLNNNGKQRRRNKFKSGGLITCVRSEQKKMNCCMQNWHLADRNCLQILRSAVRAPIGPCKYFSVMAWP